MFSRIAALFRRHPVDRRHPAGAPSTGGPAGAGPSAGAGSNSGQPTGPALPPNQMLQRIIAGRTISAVAQDTAPASLTFADGSVMKIKTGAALPADALLGKTVQHVRQGGLSLQLQFQDGSAATLTLAEETSSVLLRDAKGAFEYAD
jgi:hypothetical protein